MPVESVSLNNVKVSLQFLSCRWVCIINRHNTFLPLLINLRARTGMMLGSIIMFALVGVKWREFLSIARLTHSLDISNIFAKKTVDEGQKAIFVFPRCSWLVMQPCAQTYDVS